MFGRLRAALRGRDHLGASPQFVDLLKGFGLRSLDRQLQLDRIAGDAEWSVDQGAGTITLGRIVSPVQFIGSEAESPRSWMWAWGNPYVDEPLTSAAKAVRLVGERDGVPELIAAEFALAGALSGHLISLVAAGLADAAAYYRAPYPGGAAFVLLTDHGAVPDVTWRPIERAQAVISAASLALPFAPAPEGVAAYLLSLGLNPSRVDESVVARDGADELRIHFDHAGRIAAVRSDFQP